MAVNRLTSMSALSNAHTQEGGKPPLCVGVNSNAPPEKIKKGVSVKYAHDPNKKWHVLRVTYHREQKAFDYLLSMGLQVYMPMQYSIRTENGRKHRIKTPLIPNILFVYTEPETINQHIKGKFSVSFITYYYNHFQKLPDGKNPPLVVPYHDMMNFIRVTATDNEHVRMVQPHQCHYKGGEKVRVVDGDFAGVVGRVARVSGQQRVVVELEGVCLVSTAYIPTAFLRKME